MKNTGSRWGGAQTAGVFLQKFVKDVKWAHIDIAGVAFLEKSQKELWDTTSIEKLDSIGWKIIDLTNVCLSLKKVDSLQPN